MRFFLPIFIVVPIVEMLILIEVGGIIGALPTVALVMLTALIGLGLLKQQGVSTLMRVNQKLATGEVPAEEVFEGVLLAVGGALLLTPGFFTDAIGFACLIPFTRKALVKKMLAKGMMMGMQSMQNGSGFEYQEFHFHSSTSPDQNDVIDGEYSKVDEEKKKKK